MTFINDMMYEIYKRILKRKQHLEMTDEGLCWRSKSGNTRIYLNVFYGRNSFLTKYYAGNK